MPGSSAEEERLAALGVDDPALQPGGRVQKLPPTPSKLGGAVPVRFRPETIEAVKGIAHTQGVSVSAWIRHQVERSVYHHESLSLRANVYPIGPAIARQWIDAEERRHRVGVAG